MDCKSQEKKKILAHAYETESKLTLNSGYAYGLTL